MALLLYWRNWNALRAAATRELAGRRAVDSECASACGRGGDLQITGRGLPLRFHHGEPNAHVYRLTLGLQPLPVVWKIRDAIALDVKRKPRVPAVGGFVYEINAGPFQ